MTPQELQPAAPAPAPPARPSRGVPLLAAVALLGACTTSHYERRADRSALRILEEGTQRTVGSRRETVVYPQPVAEQPAIEAPPAEPQEGEGPPADRVERRVLTLEEALETGIALNRDYKTREETLYLQALSLASTRHDFAPQLAATLSYLFADGSDLPSAQDSGFDASLDQILPWGGNVRVSAQTGFEDVSVGGTPTDSRTFSSSLGIQLTQPLLRGAGAMISHEPLVQAERNLVYAIRGFELFREDFSIDVARRYYNLVQQKQSIDNQRQNLEGFVFGRRQAEALFQVGRTNELDVLRARRSELISRDELIAAEESYELTADRFRIFLGLPATDPIDVQPQSPTYVPARFDVDGAVAVALVNRLDLLNRQGQLEDAERAVRIARDGLGPDLDLTVGYNVGVGPDGGFTRQRFAGDSVTAGVRLGLPVDRVSERNAYRTARLTQVRAIRDFEEFRDTLVVEIESAFRELERRRQSLDIQGQLITDQEKNVKIARLRFEQGDFSNRDVVEAEEALLEARNTLIREQVDYEISRLQLLRDMGILFIDENGMWTR